MQIALIILLCLVCSAIGLMIGACLTAAKRGDAVDVVRCKECALLDTATCPMSECNEIGEEIYEWKTVCDGYCSYGERTSHDKRNI